MCAWVHVRACLCVSVSVSVSVFECVCMCMRTHVCLSVSLCISARVCARVCALQTCGAQSCTHKTTHTRVSTQNESVLEQNLI